MTEQEARSEAERRYPNDRYEGHLLPGAIRNARREAFEKGAAWERARLSSRVVEAAPSDTDRKAAIEAVAQVMFEPPSLGQVDDPEYTWAQMVVEDPTRADMYRQDAAAALEAAARASQPVQVEVTNEMVERAADAIERTWAGGGHPNATRQEFNRARARAALTAALGGGE